MAFNCRYLTCYQKEIPDWNVLSLLGKGTQIIAEMITIFTISEYLNIEWKKKTWKGNQGDILGPKRKENLWIGYFLEMHQNSRHSLMSIAKC